MVNVAVARMPPDGSGPSGSAPVSEPIPALNRHEDNKKSKGVIDESTLDPRLLDVNSDYFPPLEIVWRNVWLFAYLHAAALVGLYLLAIGQVQWKTVVWGKLKYIII